MGVEETRSRGRHLHKIGPLLFFFLTLSFFFLFLRSQGVAAERARHFSLTQTLANSSTVCWNIYVG